MLRAAADATCKSDTGRQRRDNEDSALARAPVFVVADGMGGAQAGEVASQIAIEAFEQPLEDAGSTEERLAGRVKEANRRIYDRSRAEQGREGMGTTLTAAYLDGSELSIAHVGDSRAYLLRDGNLKRLTQDHSLVDELVRRGKLTEEQAAEHPQRSIITRALGPEPEVEVDTATYSVRAGDLLLLCSDGLTSMISEGRLKEILAGASALNEAADQLIAEANEAGGRDNITVVLFRLEEVGTDGALDHPTTVAPAPVVAPQRPSDRQRTEAPAAAATPPTVAPPPAVAGARAGAATKAPPRVIPASKLAGRDRRERARWRYRKPLAALLALLIVLFLLGGGGYLATRQLYFIGTNQQGIVTIYRGLPYDLPAGIHLYETFYVSGVPASLVPGDRRSQLLNNQLRSQKDASTLVRDLELGKIVR